MRLCTCLTAISVQYVYFLSLEQLAVFFSVSLYHPLVGQKPVYSMTVYSIGSLNELTDCACVDSEPVYFFVRMLVAIQMVT